MTIIPRGHMVLVKPDSEASRVSEHGIVTPVAVEQERKAVGTIVAMSPAVEMIDMNIQVGAKVIYGVYSGETVTDGKEEYKLLYVSDDKDNEVLAFIR